MRTPKPPVRPICDIVEGLGGTCWGGGGLCLWSFGADARGRWYVEVDEDNAVAWTYYAVDDPGGLPF